MEAQFEQYWTIKQISERLHSSEPSIRRWLSNGAIEKTKAGARTLISESALQAFLRSSAEKSKVKTAA